jgi:hypothetical protein
MDIHDTETGTNKVYHISKYANKEAYTYVQMKGKVEYRLKVKDNGRRNEKRTA